MPVGDLPVFALEEWFRRFAFEPDMVNLSASNPISPTVGELLALTGTPSRVLEEISLDYSETPGLPRLRASIASLYDDLDPAGVVVTSGALEAILLTLLCTLERAERVLVETPIYGAYGPLLDMVGADVRPFELRPRDGYGYDPERFGTALRTLQPSVVIINPFNNPTGRGVDSAASLARVFDLSTTHGCRLLSDEVFRLIPLSGSALPSVIDLGGRPGGNRRALVGSRQHPAEAPAPPIALGDMTKAWGLGGLRIGWVATRDPGLVVRLLDARDYTTNSCSRLSEEVAVLALSVRDQLLAGPLEQARAARAAVADLIDASGGALAWYAPSGGFCGWVEVTDAQPGEVVEACERLATEQRILLLPGSVFGPTGDRFVRVGLATGADALTAGLTALLGLLGRD